MRSILGAILGYITMTIVVITGHGIAGYFFHLDYTSRSAPPATYLLVSVFFAFLAANIGGFVATAVARQNSLHPALALMALSIAMAVLTFFNAPAPQPLWYMVVVMAAMIVGVLLGARLRIRAQVLSARSPDDIEQPKPC